MLLVDDAIDYRGGISQPPHELCNVSLRRDPRENGRQDENRRRDRHAQSHDRPSMFKAGQEPEKRIHAAQHGKVTAIEEHDIAGVAVCPLGRGEPSGVTACLKRFPIQCVYCGAESADYRPTVQISVAGGLRATSVQV